MPIVLDDLCLDLHRHNRVVKDYEGHGVWKPWTTWLLVCHGVEHSRIATHAHTKFLSLDTKGSVVVDEAKANRLLYIP